MQFFKAFAKFNRHLFVALSVGSATLAVTHAAQAQPFQTPLFLVTQVKPVTMLNMSRDHQLFFKLYDDYSDITDSRPTLSGGALNPNYGKLPDGAPDTSYVHGFDYYGYFDSYKCYTYSTTDNRFNPVLFTANKYCNSSATNQWSGNFLNWASMTRVDAIRKMLYGGMRSTDTTSATVLERAYLPTDAHSFAKYYAGSDLPQLTPFAVNTGSTVVREQGITICNTSDPGTATLSQAATSAAGARPLLLVARGNYSLWASNERWQCRWNSSISNTSNGINGNNATISGIDAYSSSPIDAHKLGTGSAAGEFVARVSVCVSGLLALNADKNNEKCLGYAGDTVFKPTGLLQEYASTQHFGLITGSYGKNKSGGVLRKQVGSITDEIGANGIFQVPSGGKSIIKTLDSLRIYGYRYGQGLGLYHNNSHVVNTPGASQNDGCLWGTASFSNGQCVNWGNPQAEIYLESLRYLSGATTPQFDSDDSAYIPGLDRVTSWVDPITPAPAGNYCAPINILQFDASMTSYDSDNLTNVPSTLGDVDVATNFIGASEQIHGNSYFVGDNGTNSDQLCTPKSITSLASVKGSCPDAPRLEGSFKIAGLAYKARSAGIGADRKKPKTYGISLAAAVPNVVVPVPGKNEKITILPACRNIELSPNGNCAIVDFKVVSQVSDSATENSGKLYVSWEDTEQGGDYDQDMWGMIDYKVTANKITVTTDVVAESTIYDMGFGYIIGGTTNDGFHVHSGIEGFTGGDCVNCQPGDAATSKEFTIGTSNAKLLEPALKYAAKWGGYKNDNATVESIALSNPETYFKAVDPRKLEESLRAVFDALSRTGSSTTVASNSTRIDSDTNIFQALFDSRDWSGSLQAFPIKKDGKIDATNKAWDTNNTLKPSANISRNIYTYDGTSAVALTASGFSAAPAALRNALKLTSEADFTTADLRYQWLMGRPIPSMRPRTYLLGDIINSDPAYAGANNQRYNLLPPAYGASEYDAYLQDPESTTSKVNRKKAVFVGANDGMLHAFDVANGQELFAFIPRGVYGKLASLSRTDYQHTFTVDGPVYVGDAYIDHNSDGVKTWRTLVGGTLGAGGRGAYLLDVTDVLNGSSNAPRVIFDIYAGDSTPAISNDLGYSTSKMLIVPTADGGWSAIFGNGTGSINGTAKLIVMNVGNPSSSHVLGTNTTTGNGLSGMALLPNGDGVSTDAYAGDIKGNMWKFDLTNSSRGQWKVSFNGSPLIRVIDSLGNPQPITGTPTLGRNAKKMAGNGANAVPSVMVYFGTGSYSEITDLSDLSIQSIYAIADTNTALSLTKFNRNQMLQEKGILNETATVREVYPDETPVGTENYAVDWHLAGVHGWFLDLKFTSAKGERVIAKPLLLFDRLIINTFIPEPYQCSNGGSGWLMELTGVGDKFVGLTVLKNNKNQRLIEPIVGDLLPIMSGEQVFIVGSSLTAEAENPGSALEVFEGQAGAGSRGRMSWRQLK